MSGSEGATAIFLSDTPKQLATKVFSPLQVHIDVQSEEERFMDQRVSAEPAVNPPLRGVDFILRMAASHTIKLVYLRAETLFTGEYELNHCQLKSI